MRRHAHRPRRLRESCPCTCHTRFGRDHPGASGTGMAEGSAPAEDLLDTMMHVAAALRDAGIPYLLAGSFAAWARGGPIHETDLDFAVRRDDVQRAVEALEATGMTEKQTPEEWLRKLCEGDVQVDLIYAPAGL